MEYYVLARDSDTMVVTVTEGNDPLYGHGSWDLIEGPYATIEAAERGAELYEYLHKTWYLEGWCC